MKRTSKKAVAVLLVASSESAQVENILKLRRKLDDNLRVGKTRKYDNRDRIEDWPIMSASHELELSCNFIDTEVVLLT